jgi:RNA polymerase sigma factor (sigma-70 family)
MPSGSELLLDYARNRNEAAFAEFVRTHVDLVYSAAKRRFGGDSHPAAEVTQEVFIAVARHAARLAQHPVLSAWLHASTRNAAANFRRRELRHERQKQTFEAMQNLDTPAKPEGDALNVVLDPAIDDLGESDRHAIMLRFFDNRSYPEIGTILGLREEAARMRVARALEKLRTHLARRGVASTAAALGGALSTHAIASAPAGLAATVSVKAAAAAGSTHALGALYFMSMNKLYVATAAAAILAAVAGVAYKAGANSKAAPARVPARANISADANFLDETDKRATALTTWVSDKNSRRPPTASAATMEAEEKIVVLRDVLARLPEQGIPELKLATNADWHVAVDGKLETPDDYRRALAKLRSLAESRFGKLAQPALRDYLQANNQQFPSDASQLQSFVGADVDLAMLQRYKIAPSGEIANVRMGGDWIVTQRELIDSEYDNHLVIGPNGFGSCSSTQSASARAVATLKPVMAAYKAARGERFSDVSELLPYANTPEQRAAIEKLKRESAEGR